MKHACIRERLFSKILVCLLIVIVVSFSLSTILVAHAEAAESIENFWTTKQQMPTARSEFGVAVVNGKIYAIGGYGNGCLNVNEEYDPATNTWATKKLMPTARGSFAIAVYQNKIYVMGGSIGFDWAKEENMLCSFNEVYDPLTDTWETKTSMPTNRSQLNANVVNGKIYLIGGRTGGQYTTVSLNEVYDPSTDTWTTKEPIPYPVVEYASAVVDNKIYVIGGQDEFHPDVNVDFNQIYDPETDTWSYGASLPTAVWQAAAGATTGIMAPKKIYVIGGMPRHDADGTNITQVYNPENDTWTFGASMPTARCDLAVAVVNDVLYAIGGHPGFMVLPPNYAKNEQYTPIGYGTIPFDNNQPEPFPVTWVVAAIAISAIAVVGAALLVYFRKFRKKAWKAEKLHEGVK